MIPNNFDEAFERVKQLVQVFKQNEKRYLAPDYSEAQARLDFIDKFWIALGWDVYHETQTNPYEQEVKVERSLDVGGRRKRADYAFLASNFRDVRFFAEAKKPHPQIDNTDDYFQTIRYGWSGQTPLAVLTDFAHFRVLDSRYKPDLSSALQQVRKAYNYSDYTDRDKFSEIYYLFSREAANSGSLERYAANLPKPTGKVQQRGLFASGYQSIDFTFLSDLDGYREQLARTFKETNPNLDGYELTEVTQRTLDRLVFMRFLEDKLIEPDPIIERLGTKGTAWQDFVEQSRRLDSIYNGIIFKKHRLLDAPNFLVDENVFGAIRDDLAHTNSPYDFNSIPIHILGSIYERFLGKVIIATDTKATVQEKPEVRKAGGVYYTPEHIVRYIAANTVGRVIKGEKPEAIRQLRFVDIACGSGSFLLGVYDLLLRYHTTYYNANKRTKAEGRRAGCLVRENGGLQLSLLQKREILLNNIYGVDIDPQAVEVAQLSLYLKLLEDETPSSARNYQLAFREALLPSLDKNIKCGNSLVSFDIRAGFLDERRLNPMSFESAFPHIMRSGGFDAVVGNPPYIDSEWMSVHHPETREYCTSVYRAASGNWDIFCVFIEKALELTKHEGFTSLIVPNKLGSAGYAAGARDVLTKRNKLISIRDYSSVPVFPVSVYPIVYVAEKRTPDIAAKIQYERMAINSDGAIETALSSKLDYKRYFSNYQLPWSIFGDIESVNPTERVRDAFPALGSVATVLGAATVAEAYELIPLLEHAQNSNPDGLRLINSGTIDRYSMLWGKKPCRYLGTSYLRPIVSEENIDSLPTTRLNQAQQPKIIISGMTKILECVVDLAGGILAGKSTTIVMSHSLDLRYLLGILNSKFMTFYYISVFGGNRLQGGYLRIGPPQLRTVPIPLANTTNKQLYNDVIKLVDQMLDAIQNLNEARTDRDSNFYEEKCRDLDRRIDKVVYKLYSLTDEEIGIIEAS
jgi:adenine-specific DNA-methyltransferase